jgi:CRP/FNR family transcriptional regulator, nitrogen oxide reductase regulator
VASSRRCVGTCVITPESTKLHGQRDDRYRFADWQREYPQLTENSFRIALDHLGTYVKRHASIMTESAESRLAQTLLQLANDDGEVQPSGIAVDITNEQLSSLADTSPFTASRILSKWAHEGNLSRQRRRVTLLDPDALMAV